VAAVLKLTMLHTTTYHTQWKKMPPDFPIQQEFTNN